MTITWNTDINAPCCLGEIVNEDGRSLLVQTDWDYPGVAKAFGWSLRAIQRCPKCRAVLGEGDLMCQACYHDLAKEPDPICAHPGTDGTIDCPDCGLSAGAFIGAAAEWLASHDGAIADDPGYFEEDSP